MSEDSDSRKDSRQEQIEQALAAFVPEQSVTLVEVVRFDGRYIAVETEAFDSLLAWIRQHNERVRQEVQARETEQKRQGKPKQKPPTFFEEPP